MRKIPFELRGMIFKGCLQIGDGKNPALLIALRGNRALYEQALEVYYMVNYYTLSNPTAQWMNELSPKAISSIKEICILNGAEWDMADKLNPLLQRNKASVETLWMNSIGVGLSHDAGVQFCTLASRLS